MKLKSLAALVLCAAGCTGLPQLDISDHLYINQSKTHYKVEKSRESGEKDLQAIVMDSAIEEAWVFNQVDSHWIEIGYSEEVSSVLYDSRIINSLVSADKKPIIYHTHHAKSIERFEKNYIEYLETEKRLMSTLENQFISQGFRINTIQNLLNAVEQKRISRIITLSSAFPSETDILSGNTYNFGITQAVASKFGIIEWRYNQKEINEYLSAYSLLQRRLMGAIVGANEEIINIIVTLLNTTQDQITLSFRPWNNTDPIKNTKLVFQDGSRR